MKDLLKKALLKLKCRYFRKSIREILFFNIPHDGFANGIPVSILLKKKKEDKFIEKKNKLNIQRVKMSSIIDDKNKTIYVIKESVGGENKVSNIIERLILKDIKNNLRSKEEVNHYDGN